MRKSLSVTLVGVLALGAGAAAAYGWEQWRPWGSAGGPSASPTASPVPVIETTPIAYDGRAAAASVPVFEALPACGEAWDLEPNSQQGLTIHPSLENWGGPGSEGPEYGVSTTFTNDGPDTRTFMAATSMVVVVKDGVVVGSPFAEEYWLETLTVEPGTTSPVRSSMGIDGTSLCDARPLFEELWETIDWENATDEDYVALDAETSRLRAIYAALEPGEYTFYAWSPVVFGPHAAAARLWMEEGVEWVDGLRDPWPENPLMEDPRLAQYCSGLDTFDPNSPDAWESFVCAEIPDEVWDEVLTRDVPVSYIDNTETFFLVSEPITLIVE